MVTRTAQTLRRFAIPLLGFGLLLVYALAIVLDLPTPAGTKYRQALPDSELVAWGVTPVPGAQPAPHWWYKIQALRGWSNNPEGWAWSRNTARNAADGVALALLALVGAGLLWVERRLALPHNAPHSAPHSGPHSGRLLALLLILLICYTYALQVTLLAVDIQSENGQELLVERTTDYYFNGYFDSGLRFRSLSNYFKDYSTTLQDRAFCPHCRTHPPGPVLYYWSLYHLMKDVSPALTGALAGGIVGLEQLNAARLPPDTFLTAWVGGNIILFLSATIVIPLYGLARRVGRPQIAFPLAALGAVIPGILLMSPEFDQMYAVFSAWMLYFAIRGLQTPRHAFRWGALAGLVFAFSIYWSIGLLLMAAPLFLLFAWALWGSLRRGALALGAAPTPLRPRESLAWLAGLAAGGALPWILLVFPGGFPLLAIFRVARANHLYGITIHRPYAPWLVFNLVDFFQFLGLPLLAVLLAAFARTWREGARAELQAARAGISRGGGRLLAGLRAVLRGALAPANALALGFGLVILSLDLSGTTRGEVGRLWIFLMPLGILAVYAAASRTRLSLPALYELLAAQFLVCALIGMNWVTP